MLGRPFLCGSHSGRPSKGYAARVLKPVLNPPNPYESREVEWLGPPPVARVEIFEEEARSVVSENDSPDVDFRYSVNPYRGCLHACAYCYARPGHERLGFGAGTDFETRIVVKTNVAEVLRRELLSPTWPGELIAFSGDTDCYQAIEASYRLTRRCLEVCAEFRQPVGSVTKSPLVRRDLDLPTELAKSGAVEVAISVAFVDRALQEKVEPGAPPPRARFEALAALAAAGIPTSVLVAPIIPGLNDREIPAVLEAAKAAGASGAGRILLRLPGSGEAVFLERMATAFPERRARIENRIRDVRGGGLSDPRFHHRHVGRGAYWEAIEALFELHCTRLGLARRPRPRPPTPFRRPGGTQLELFD